MIEVKINDDGTPHVAFITTTDLHEGKHIIYLGGNTEKLDLCETLYEYNMPYILAHESTHIAIYDVTKNALTSKMLDNHKVMEATKQ